MAINNKHQVAFSFMVDGEMHGWVYLPEDDYGLLAGIHDLSVLTPGVTRSAAWDLTDAGWVCGRANFTMDDPLLTGQAIVWQLGDPIEQCLLGFLVLDPLNPGEWSVAYAIKESESGVVTIVGDADAGTQSTCTRNNAGFWVAYDGQCPPPALVGLPPGAQPASYARDVNTPASPFDNPLIAGFAWHRLLPDICPNGPIQCEPARDAVVWPATDPTGALALAKLPGDNGHEARGSNDSDMIVGAGFDAADPICRLRAPFWESPTDPSPDILPTESPQSQARAEAINDAVPPQVVGWNEDLQLARLWEQDGQGNWNTAIDLNGVIGPCSANWTLFQAHDISSDGWIAGWGMHEGEIQAFLLTPIETCLWDLNGDCCVDRNDLSILLGQWGQCPPPPAVCPADFNCDGWVRADDKQELIAHFGLCPNADPLSCPPVPGPQCLSISGAGFQGAVGALGFGSVGELQAWLMTAEDGEAFVCGCALWALLPAQE